MLATTRFAMSAPPQPGGEPGLYEEQVAQWVAEKSFFRDFVYRNAKGKKKGDQLVDGIVLFGDVMLLIEVKAQIGLAKRDDWVRDRLGKAVIQLEKSKTLLQGGSVPKLRNDFYGELDFVPQNYPNVFGSRAGTTGQHFSHSCLFVEGLRVRRRQLRYRRRHDQFS